MDIVKIQDIGKTVRVITQDLMLEEEHHLALRQEAVVRRVRDLHLRLIYSREIQWFRVNQEETLPCHRDVKPE